MMNDAAAEAGDATRRISGDALLDCLVALCRIHGRPVAPESLRAGLPLRDERLTPSLFLRAARDQGLSATVARRRLNRISNLLLPAVLLLEGGDACILVKAPRRGKAQVLVPDAGDEVREVSVSDLGREYSGVCIFVHPVAELDARLGDEPPPALRRRGWFWGTLWRFRGYYSEALLSTALVNLLALATALFIMNVYDRVVPNNATETLIVLAIGTGAAIGFEFLARTLRSYFLDVAGKKADVLLASRLFQQAMGLRMEARPGSSGAFASQLREFESLRDFCASATLATLSDLPFIAFFIWVISIIGGPLFWVATIAVPLVLVVGLLAQIPLSIIMRQNLRESSLKHGLLVEAVEGTDTIKSLTAEGRMLERFEDYSALTGRSATRGRFVSSAMVNFTMLVQQAVTVATVVWGVFLIAEGTLTVGALIACVILSGRGLAPLGQVAGLMARYQHARAAYFTLDAIMKQPVERPVGRRFLQRIQVKGRLEASAVRFAYPEEERVALEDVSLRIDEGERVALLGRVGSGKTSLLRLLVGLYAPIDGAILLDDVDMSQLDPALVRRRVGYLDQHPRLFFGTLRENVTMGAPQAGDDAVLAALAAAGLETLVSRHPMGLDMPVGERGEGLSGGQRQCVAIARMLLMEPRVLLMDEPTAFMDHNTEQVFLSALVGSTRGRTLVVATHKPSVVAQMDRIVVLDAGKVVMDGPRDQVLAQLAGPVRKSGVAP